MGTVGGNTSGGLWIWDDKAVLSPESFTEHRKQLVSISLLCLSEYFSCRIVLLRLQIKGFNCQGRAKVAQVWFPYCRIILSPWWRPSITAAFAPSTVSTLSVFGPQCQSLRVGWINGLTLRLTFPPSSEGSAYCRKALVQLRMHSHSSSLLQVLYSIEDKDSFSLVISLLSL